MLGLNLSPPPPQPAAAHPPVCCQLASFQKVGSKWCVCVTSRSHNACASQLQRRAEPRESRPQKYHQHFRNNSEKCEVARLRDSTRRETRRDPPPEVKFAAAISHRTIHALKFKRALPPSPKKYDPCRLVNSRHTHTQTCRIVLFRADLCSVAIVGREAVTPDGVRITSG